MRTVLVTMRLKSARPSVHFFFANFSLSRSSFTFSRNINSSSHRDEISVPRYSVKIYPFYSKHIIHVYAKINKSANGQVQLHIRQVAIGEMDYESILNVERSKFVSTGNDFFRRIFFHVPEIFTLLRVQLTRYQ